MKSYISIAIAMSIAAHSQADILINEVDADQSGTDNAEFVELFDGGQGNSSLSDYSLVFYNGNGAQSYKSVSLSTQKTNDSGYFVICGDTTTVNNCDLDIGANTKLIQNGADAVALYQRPASDFANGSGIQLEGLVDALVYDTNDSDNTALLSLLNPNQPQVNEDDAGDKDNHSNQRCGNLLARTTDGYVQAQPTPGLANNCVASAPVLGACGDSSHSHYKNIHTIQGNQAISYSDASPLLGETVVVEAIVTADLQGGQLANGDSSYQYSGYWLQHGESEYDNDAMTSEGIFVYDYQSNVSVGDRVRLLATVGEYNEVTQLKNVQDFKVCAQAQPLPSPVAINLPIADLHEWEALEGMRIQTQQNLMVSDLFGTGYGFGNYGQFVVSSKLHYQPTEIARPGSAEAQAAFAARPLDTLLVDDGVAAAYPSFIPFPNESGFSAQNPMRIGYQVPYLMGVMHEYRDNYTVIPNNITIDPVSNRSLSPQVAPESDIVIAGMNVLNYFNGDGQGNGFPTSRGAPSYEAFEMQTQKIVSALVAINADIIGLMEIENDGYSEQSAIADLVAALNAQQTAGNEYQFINPGREQIGTDAIAVGLLYRPAVVQPIGTTAILDSSNSALDDMGNPLFVDNKNRPSLIQSFQYQETVFTVSVNHLKSKGSACNEPNEGELGVGNCNQTRTNAAKALSLFLADNPTGVESTSTLILGDLNAYSQEDPMHVFYNNGFSNLKYTDKATEEKPFSYSFSGFLGSLDHALASDMMLPWIASVDAWHINSVEAPLMDYLTEANGQKYQSIDNYAAPDAYRSSDHDPIIIGLDMPEANQTPQQIQDIGEVTVRKHQSKTLQLNTYFSDADGDTLTFGLENNIQGISLTNAGRLTIQLSASQMKSLPLQLTINVSDGKAQIQTQISVVADSPKQTAWDKLWNWVGRFLKSLFSW